MAFVCDFPTSSDCLPKQKRPWRSRCSPMKRGTAGLRMCLPLQARNRRRCWGRFRMSEASAGCQVVSAFLLFALLFPVLSCSAKPDANTLVMIIESSPTNLDPRVGIDAQSERIDNLIFDDLLSRGDDLNVQPGLAERWEIPDPLTYVFHIRQGVKFHDGRTLTSRDVKWTFDSLLQGKIRSTKAAAYRPVDRIDAPDDYTVVFHLKEPFATFLWNVSDGAIGIVPSGSGEEMSRHPIGSGPFR